MEATLIRHSQFHQAVALPGLPNTSTTPSTFAEDKYYFINSLLVFWRKIFGLIFFFRTLTSVATAIRLKSERARLLFLNLAPSQLNAGTLPGTRA